MGKTATENDFEKYKHEYETTQSKELMDKHFKLFQRIFIGYALASKRGVKLIPLRQFKMAMRDLGIIPNISTEYKCA